VHEVDLCGHATLASGFVVLTELEPERDAVTFTTREAGELIVRREGERFRMTLPARPPAPIAIPSGLSDTLGVEPLEVLRASKLTAVLESEVAVAALTPDLAWVAAHETDGLIVTARGDRVDFVSRFFAPGAGIDEDPVTGSAHCELAPYWATELGRDHLEARQISARGGALSCEVDGDRVHLVGDAVLFLRGCIDI
jgi:PhzF family phenazine biosynthesis protein